jgi:methionyl-tRNA formyltransferase
LEVVWVRVAFAGSAEFSLPSLRALANSAHQVELVITAPDRLGSRGRPAPRPVRELASELGLPVIQPARLARDDLLAAPAGTAQVLAVCAYGQLVPRSVLDLFPRGAVGVHPSLLPRHRGASPIQAAILAGDTETGVTIYQMDERLDAGPVLAQQRLPLLPSLTATELSEELAARGGSLLVSVLDELEAGASEPSPQADADATYSAKVGRRDGELDWSLPALEIERRLRALHPWPGVSLPVGGERVKLIAGRAVPPPDGSAVLEPGSILEGSADFVLVGTSAGSFQVELVQPPGGRVMAPAAYLRGRRSSPGEAPQ